MACGCAARPLAPLAPPGGLGLDPEGRHRVAARDHQLRQRKDLAPSDGVSPPCRRPLGAPPKYRPECPARAEAAPVAAPTAAPVALVAQPDHDDDPLKDCKCEVKGSCKKVRFPAEVLPEDAPSSCARQHVAPPPPPQCGGPSSDGPAANAASAVTHRAPAAQQPHAPCNCPCWAAYSPDPPASLATGDIYRTCRLPKRFQYPAWFTGYNTGPKHPLYRTTSSDIGRYPPTVHTVTTIYRPADRSTSKIYVPAGPWRNRSLCNTGSIWDIYNYYNNY